MENCPTFQKHFNFSPLELIFGEIFCWGEIWAIIQRILAKLKHFFSILQQANALQCDVCLKIFSRESSLKRHLVTVHIGVRAFQCFLCGRAFTQSGNMRAHQQAVHFFLPAGRKEQRRPQPVVKLVITRADGIYTCRPADASFAGHQQREVPVADGPGHWPLPREPDGVARPLWRPFVSQTKKILIFFNRSNCSIFFLPTFQLLETPTAPSLGDPAVPEEGKKQVNCG